MRRRPAMAMAALSVLWGTIGIVVRWTALPAAPVAFARSAIAAAALTAVSWARDRRPPWRTALTGRQRRWIVVYGALLAAHWLFMLAAYQRAPIGVVLVIVYLYPSLATAVAPKLLGEQVGRRQVVALVLSLAGVAVLARPGGGGGVGVLLALAASVLWAAIAVGIKRHLPEVPSMRLTSLQLTVAAVVLAPFAALARWGAPTKSWWWLAVLGVVLTAGAMSGFVVLLQRLPVTTASVIACIEPVAAVFFAWWALAERPGWRTVVGGTLVLTAAIMVATAPAPRAGSW